MSEIVLVHSNNFKELISENEQLRSENEKLKLEITKLKELVGDDSMTMSKRLEMMNKKLLERIDILRKVVKNNDKINSKDTILESERIARKEYDLKMLISRFNKKPINKIPFISYMNVFDITDFYGMFYYCESLKNLEGLLNWNVSNGVNFSYMFYGCSDLSDIESLYGWNVSNGVNFNGMFRSCSSLKTLKGLNHWDVSKGTDFDYMFSGTSIKDIEPLVNWCIPKEYDVRRMFKYDCSNKLPGNITEDDVDWLNKNIKRHD